MLEKLLLAATITFSLNLFLGVRISATTENYTSQLEAHLRIQQIDVNQALRKHTNHPGS